MRCNCVIYIILALLSSITSTWSQDLNSEITNVFEDNDLMGLSVFVHTSFGEEEVYLGLRDFDRNLPVNSDTKFRIASISKTVTALGVIKLVEDGFINLDDDISAYLDYSVRNPLFPNVPITFRMLLSHSSSLQDGDGYNNFLNATFAQLPVPNISELIIPQGSFYTSNMWRLETPGSFFAYSNINFGLLGTLIEKISGDRFDAFMKSKILDPLELDASFNVIDINDINDIAVLYRNISGSWTPQTDNYQGVPPTPPNLGDYTVGTNGVYFGPQGSLRISSKDISTLMRFIKNNGAGFNLNISSENIAELKEIAWNFNGTNGDNYFGLFNRWGLGTHHANTVEGDQICALGEYGSFIGHPGEAFGLISDAYFNEEEDINFSFIINGKFNGYEFGDNSSYYKVEESLFEVLCNYFNNDPLSITENTSHSLFSIYPNPTNEYININHNSESDFNIIIYDYSGKKVRTKNNLTSNTIVDISQLSKGIYYLVLESDESFSIEKIILK